MKVYKTKKILKSISLVLAALTPLLSSAPVLAATATESLSSVASATKGSAVYVTLRENSGAEPVNVATAVISYPADKLSYVSVANSSAFVIAAATSGGAGTVRVDRGALPAVSGSQTVATIRFKALLDSGTAAITIASGTVYSANSSANIYAGGSGTNVALKPVPPAAPAAPVAPKDTIPPKITAVKISQETVTSALVTWTTSEPATSEVSYGRNQGYGLSAVDGQLVTDHKITLNSPIIAPATLYHVMVKSTDAAGNPASSPDATFTTKGATLIVTVKSKSGNKLVAGAEVTLLSQKAVTGKDGKATLTNLPEGKITGAVKYKKNQTVISTIIQPVDDKSQPQTLAVTVSTAGISPLVYLLGLLILLAAAGAYLSRRYPAVTAAIMKKLRRISPPPPPPGPPSSPRPPDTIIRPNSN